MGASRVHCTISREGTMLRDLSRNGTFLNGQLVQKGAQAALSEGDRISLVLSVAPLAESSFTFHAGAPPGTRWPLPGSPLRQQRWVGWGGAVEPAGGSSTDANGSQSDPDSQVAAAGAEHPPPSPTRRSAALAALRRSATSTYATPAAALAEPLALQCLVCLDTQREAVALEPCGHSFCAACLSHHLAALMLRGLQLGCPMRCASPQRVVVNSAVRSVVCQLELAAAAGAAESSTDSAEFEPRPAPFALGGAHQNQSAPREMGGLPEDELLASSGGSGEEEQLRGMHALVPLDDASLPLDVVGLNDGQLGLMLSTLERAASDAAADSDDLLAAMEALTRLAWSNGEVRRQIGTNGMQLVIRCMRTHEAAVAVQCCGCLSLLALIRGEDDLAAGLRGHVAHAGGLETILACMRAHPRQPMVQLSALMCLVPLALEGTVLQSAILEQGLADILSALEMHMGVQEVAAKALLAVGALAQGESAAAEAAAERISRSTAPRLVAAALWLHGRDSEDVLWAALFTLAVLARVGNDGVFVARMTRVASAGVLQPLQLALQAHTAHVGAEIDEDEVVLAGQFVTEALSRSERLLWLRRLNRWTAVLAVGTAVVLGLRSYHRVQGRADSAASSAPRGRAFSPRTAHSLIARLFS